MEPRSAGEAPPPRINEVKATESTAELDDWVVIGEKKRPEPEISGPVTSRRLGHLKGMYENHKAYISQIQRDNILDRIAAMKTMLKQNSESPKPIRTKSTSWRIPKNIPDHQLYPDELRTLLIDSAKSGRKTPEQLRDLMKLYEAKTSKTEAEGFLAKNLEVKQAVRKAEADSSLSVSEKTEKDQILAELKEAEARATEGQGKGILYPGQRFDKLGRIIPEKLDTHLDLAKYKRGIARDTAEKIEAKARNVETAAHVEVWGEQAFDSLVPAARKALESRKASMTAKEKEHIATLQRHLLNEKKVKDMHPDELEKLVAEFESKTSPEALEEVLHLRPHDRYPYSTTKWSPADTLMANRQKAYIDNAKEKFLSKYPTLDSLPAQDRIALMERQEKLWQARPDLRKGWTYEDEVRRTEGYPSSKYWSQVRSEARQKYPIREYAHQKLEPKDLGYEGNDMRWPDVHISLPEGGTCYIPKYQQIFEAHGGPSSWHRNR
jgi:hypothetical protein